MVRCLLLVDDSFLQRDEVALLEVAACDVPIARAATFLAQLKALQLPHDPRLRHVKVLRHAGETSRCLLCCADQLPALGERLRAFGAEPLVLQRVPAQAPRSQAEVAQLSAIWPVKFLRAVYPHKLAPPPPVVPEWLRSFVCAENSTFAQCAGGAQCAASCAVFRAGARVCEVRFEGGAFPDHAVLRAVARVAALVRARGSALLPAEQYYCSGLEFAVSAEPCVMCAMALTHSRVAAVYVAVAPAAPTPEPRAYDLNADLRTVPVSCAPRKNPAGGLFTDLSVVFCRALNHHFCVYLCWPEPGESGAAQRRASGEN